MRGKIATASESLSWTTIIALSSKNLIDRFEPCTVMSTRFRKFYTCFGCETKTEYYVFWLFFRIDLRSATSMESSRQDLWNDVAEHRSILKHNQNMQYPRFSFLPAPNRYSIPYNGCFVWFSFATTLSLTQVGKGNSILKLLFICFWMTTPTGVAVKNRVKFGKHSIMTYWCRQYYGGRRQARRVNLTRRWSNTRGEPFMGADQGPFLWIRSADSILTAEYLDLI